MDFYDLVKSRSSIRTFQRDRPIPEEVLHRVLEAGRMAPSACNLQPWRILVVRTPAMLEKIYPCYQRPWIQEAPCLLIVTGESKNAWVRQKDGYNSIETDLGIVMDHLVLAAASEGLGTCWIAAFDKEMLKQALGMREEEELFAFTPLGYPAPNSPPMPKSRKPLEEIVRFL
ncbi:MAG: nitroreductase family protein [Chlorobiaceae bacterium]